MKKKNNGRIWLALIAVTLAWTLTAGAAYGVNVFTKSLNASVTIQGTADFSYYGDPGATQLTTEVSLPIVSPGEISTFTVYLKNTGSVVETISTGPNTIPPSIGTLTLTFNGQAQIDLVPGAVCTIVGTLIVAVNAPATELDFAFAVNAVPATSTTILPTTPPPTTIPVLNGQQLFASNCITCHSSGTVNTSRTQSQLLTFIPGHRTGSTLTQR